MVLEGDKHTGRENQSRNQATPGPLVISPNPQPHHWGGQRLAQGLPALSGSDNTEPVERTACH